MPPDEGPLPPEHSPLPALAARIAAGERRAETEFVERFQPGIKALVRRRLRPGDPDIADLSQDVLRIVLEKLRANAIRDPHAIPGFIQTTIHFVTNQEYRRRSRTPETGAQAAIEATPDEREPATSLEAVRLTKQLPKLLAELTVPRDRKALELFYLAEKSTDEVCAELGLEPSDFHRVISRARQRFRQILVEAGIRGAST